MEPMANADILLFAKITIFCFACYLLRGTVRDLRSFLIRLRRREK